METIQKESVVRHQLEKTGVVVSDKMDKTRIVFVERLSRHPLYQKTIRQKKKFCVHDSENLSKVGDSVRIRQVRPLSKRKCWSIIGIVREAKK